MSDALKLSSVQQSRIQPPLAPASTSVTVQEKSLGRSQHYVGCVIPTSFSVVDSFSQKCVVSKSHGKYGNHLSPMYPLHPQ